MGSSPKYLSSYIKSFEQFPQYNNGEKKSAVKQKKTNLIGSFSALAEISHMGMACVSTVIPITCYSTVFAHVLASMSSNFLCWQTKSDYH